MRGATPINTPRSAEGGISIHAPHAGCDLVRSPLRNLLQLHFNPRTPCGVRPTGIENLARQLDFNPRTPCGVRPCPYHRQQISARFQSTHPMRGATWRKAASAEAIKFQSTHPMRGATKLQTELISSTRISIHAPHAGCDSDSSGKKANCFHFNPRTPCGVRPHGALSVAGDGLISIHAPHAGCDRIRPALRPARHHFNPRTPCGVRLQYCLTMG